MLVTKTSGLFDKCLQPSDVHDTIFDSFTHKGGLYVGFIVGAIWQNFSFDENWEYRAKLGGYLYYPFRFYNALANSQIGIQIRVQTAIYPMST